MKLICIRSILAGTMAVVMLATAGQCTVFGQEFEDVNEAASQGGAADIDEGSETTGASDAGTAASPQTGASADEGSAKEGASGDNKKESGSTSGSSRAAESAALAKERPAPVYDENDLKRITKTADSYNAIIYGNEDWDDVGPAVDDKYGGLSVKDYNALVRMVYAEAGGEGEEGMLLVANVILNRMKSYKYPVTVSAVISQAGQFQPYANGRYAAVEPNEVAVRAVKRALDGENNAPGVLYFKSVRSNAVWSNKTVAFRYKNHVFYY